MTLFMTAVHDPTVDPPQVLLGVASVPGTGGTPWTDDGDIIYPNGGLISAAEPVMIYRYHPDGSRHPVLLSEGMLTGGVWVGYDYHAPFGLAVTYAALSAGDWSARTGSVTVSPQDPWLVRQPDSWLIHGSKPWLSVVIDRITSYDAISRQSRAGRFDVIGAALSVHQTASPLSARKGKIVIACSSQASLTKTLACLADGQALLLNTPFHPNDLGWIWVQPGDIDVDNPGDILAYPYRHVTIPWEETVQPDLGTYTMWASRALDALFASSLAVSNAYDTSLDLELNRRKP